MSAWSMPRSTATGAVKGSGPIETADSSSNDAGAVARCELDDVWFGFLIGAQGEDHCPANGDQQGERGQHAHEAHECVRSEPLLFVHAIPTGSVGMDSVPSRIVASEGFLGRLNDSPHRRRPLP